jgi:hypothetical protein
MNIYLVEGGIGKHVMFSALIPQLAKDEKIIVVSGYSDIFEYHPLVEVSVPYDLPGFYDKYIKDTKNNIFHSEPYYSNYIKGDRHMIESWCHLYNLGYDEQIIPELYTMEDFEKEAKKFSEENGKFIIVQFSGSQSPLNFDVTPYHANNRFGQIKDYPRVLAQKLINNIKIRWPHIKILNFALPNEEHFRLENCVSIEAPYFFYNSLLQYCESFIAIDSSLQHFSGNRFLKKKGVVLWGATGPSQLGYSKNNNITNSKDDTHPMRPLTRPVGDIFNEDGSFWENSDIQCLDLEPEVIIRELELTMKFNKDIKPSTKNIIKKKKKKKKKKTKDLPEEVKKNEELSSGKEIIEEEFIEEIKDGIVIDEETKNKLIDLNTKIEFHKKDMIRLSLQCSDIIEIYLNAKRLKGDFVLNDDCSKLVSRFNVKED